MAQAPAVADEEEEAGGTRGSQLSSRWRSAELAASADSKVDSLHLSLSLSLSVQELTGVMRPKILNLYSTQTWAYCSIRQGRHPLHPYFSY